MELGPRQGWDTPRGLRGPACVSQDQEGCWVPGLSWKRRCEKARPRAGESAWPEPLCLPERGSVGLRAQSWGPGGAWVCALPRWAGVPGLRRHGQCACESQGLGPAA